jgi:hypothetical protein
LVIEELLGGTAVDALQKKSTVSNRPADIPILNFVIAKSKPEESITTTRKHVTGTPNDLRDEAFSLMKQRNELYGKAGI